MVSVVLQHNEEDCGAACIVNYCKYHGLRYSINRIRELVGTGMNGTSLLGLKQGAEALGINAKGVRAPLEALDKDMIPLPAIAHWKGFHWVFIHSKKRGKYIIIDPAVGLRRLNLQQLREEIQRADLAMLLLTPTPKFLAQSDKQEHIGGLSRFFGYIWYYRPILAQAFVFSSVLGILSLVSPLVVQMLTDNVLRSGDIQLLTQIAIAVSIMYLVSTTIELAQSNLIAHFAQRIQLGLVLDFTQQMLRLPLKYYESRRSGEVVSRLEDIQEINQLISQVIVSLPSELCIAIISLAFMVFYSWKLTTIAIAISTLMTLSTFILLPALQEKSRDVLVLDGENQALLVETFKAAITVKTLAAAPQLWEEFQSRFGQVATLTFRTIQIGILNYSFSNLVEQIGFIILLWVGGNLVINQELSIGQLLAFIAMNRNFTAFISTTLAFVDELIHIKNAMTRFNEVMDTPCENQSDSKKPSITVASDGDIICNHLSFNHAGKINCLQDFSVNIPGGQVVAIIGKSGCGKSTLIKVIAGLYKCQSGAIHFGIYNQQDIPTDCLRQQIVLVPQDAQFWSMSILENFRLGFPYDDFEQIVKACKIVGADEFINSYDSVLGEFGSNLSGGQKQRLALARAIVNDPPILILDESTSALDPESEAQVLENIISHRMDKTTVLISHRPRVIQQADWIIYLANGKVQTQGTYSDLIAQPGEHLKFLQP